jgi:YD repeat-containing protein
MNIEKEQCVELCCKGQGQAYEGKKIESNCHFRRFKPAALLTLITVFASQAQASHDLSFETVGNNFESTDHENLYFGGQQNAGSYPATAIQSQGFGKSPGQSGGAYGSDFGYINYQSSNPIYIPRFGNLTGVFEAANYNTQGTNYHATSYSKISRFSAQDFAIKFSLAARMTQAIETELSLPTTNERSFYSVEIWNLSANAQRRGLRWYQTVFASQPGIQFNYKTNYGGFAFVEEWMPFQDFEYQRNQLDYPEDDIAIVVRVKGSAVVYLDAPQVAEPPVVAPPLAPAPPLVDKDPCPTTVGNPVELATLNKREAITCVRFALPEQDLKIGMHYNTPRIGTISTGNSNSHWKMSYSRRIDNFNLGATPHKRVLLESGDVYDFKLRPNGGYTPVWASESAKLELAPNNELKFPYPDGEVDFFDASTGLLKRHQYKDSAYLEFVRQGNASMQIKSMPSGKTVQVSFLEVSPGDWQPSSFTELNSPAGQEARTASLSYTAGKLTKFIDASGRVYQYRYDSLGRMNRVYSPLDNPDINASARFTQIDYSCTSCWTVAKETLANGATLEFTRLDGRSGWNLEVKATGTNPVAPNGNVRTTRYFTQNGAVVREFNPQSTTKSILYDYRLGSRTARSSIDQMGRSWSVTHAGELGEGFANRYQDLDDSLTYFDSDQWGNRVEVRFPDPWTMPKINRVYGGPGRALTSHKTTNNTGQVLRETSIGYSAVTINGQSVQLANLPTSITLPDGTVNRMEYDANGYPSVVRLDDAGLRIEEKTTYDARGFLTSTTNPQGVVTNYEYAQSPNSGQFGHLGMVSAEVLDPSNRAIRTEYTYDAELNLLKIVQDAGAGRLNATTLLTYELIGTDKTYGVKSITDAEGQITNFTYTPFGELASKSIVNGLGTNKNLTTSYRYTPEGWLDFVLANDGVTKMVDYDYNDAGEIFKQTDARGVTNRFDYDRKGRVSNVYVGTEAVEGKPAVNGQYVYSYDLADRIKKIEERTEAGLRTVLTREYDANGNVWKEIDGLGRITTNVYDPFDRLKESKTGGVTGGEGPLVTRYTYDRVGRLKTAVRGGAKAATTTYNYLIPASSDQWNLRTMTDPNGNVTRYDYDVFGETSAVIDARNGTTATTRNNLGFLTQTLAPGAGAKTVTYTVDKIGRVLGIAQGGRTESWSYFSSGLLSGKVDFAGRPTTNSYNNLAQLSGIDRDLVRADAAFVYKSNGLLARAISKPDGFTEEATDYDYDAANRLISQTRNGRTLTHTYDQADQKVLNYFGLGSINYGRDAGGAVNSVTGLNGNLSATYSFTSHGLLAESSRTSGGSGAGTRWYRWEFDDGQRLLKTGFLTGQAGVYDIPKSVVTTYDRDRVQARNNSGVNNSFSYDALNRLLNWMK